MSRSGGLRRFLTLSSLAIVTMLASVVTAPAAHADSAYAFTRESPKNGYGAGYWYNNSSYERLLSACDYGDKDGLRAVAILQVGSGYFEAHAAGGTNTCSDYVELRGLTPGSLYSFRACLRNGATGANVYCSDWYYGIIT